MNSLRKSLESLIPWAVAFSEISTVRRDQDSAVIAVQEARLALAADSARLSEAQLITLARHTEEMWGLLAGQREFVARMERELEEDGK